MDGVSHVLMGCCIAAASQGGLTWHSAIAYGAMSLAPDLFFVPLGVMLGREHHRTLWIPRAADWIGTRERRPLATVLSWDAPYSILGTIAVSLAIAKLLGLGLAIAYALHIVIDYPTHAGEWAVRPAFPFSKRTFQGFANAWEWPLAKMAGAWGVLAVILCVIVFVRR
jgi:membrane-bound metal-dependent hydrolase YbcI (DUF457 family)